MFDRNDLLAAIAQVYEQLAQLTRPLDQVHARRLQCRKGCCTCCVDDITVFEIEAENIRRHHGCLLAHGTPHALGACAFLDGAGACRIYEHRPYVCRTQGYPLRWLQENGEGHPVELRDICPLNDKGTPIEAIAAEDCWTVGPFEDFLAKLQADADNGQMKRVRLRDLFAKKADRTAGAG